MSTYYYFWVDGLPIEVEAESLEQAMERAARLGDDPQYYASIQMPE